VTIEDFLAAFTDATGFDLNQFKLWYAQSGTPEVAAQGTYDPRSRVFTLTLSQTCPPTPGQTVKRPMHVPLRFGLIGPNGEDLSYSVATGAVIDGDVIHLTEASQTIRFRGVAARPVPSLLRGFSAPLKLTIDLTAADLLFQMRADADPFNRWQAAQVLAVRTLLAATAAAQRGDRVAVDLAFVDALGDAAADEGLEPAFRAQLLQLPSEADIAREIGRDVDPDAIATARNAVRAAIADRIGGRLTAVIDRHSEKGPFSVSSEAAGRRALANNALDALAGNRSPAAIDQVVRRFTDADNMTDRLAALAILVATAVPERVPALAAFRDRYNDDALVLDKWLSLEASVPAPETLDRVRALLAGPAFSPSNPNRIRALIGSFAAGNQTQFNRPDGAGYDFLADFAGDLDRQNPQVAARLLVSFRSWRALEAGRRGKAESALQRIAAREGLSTDTRDIITRTLA
jgi:aminopeptidase N